MDVVQETISGEDLYGAYLSYEESRKELLREMHPPSLTEGVDLMESVGLVLEDFLPFSELKRNALQSLGEDAEEVEETTNAALVQYSIEVRHLLVCKYLSSCPKYVSTNDWSFARDELKFSKCFDRVMELRQSRSWSPLHFAVGPKIPPRKKDFWDTLLDEMAWMAADFDYESKWKMATAKLMAHEAAFRVNGSKSFVRTNLTFKTDRKFLSKILSSGHSTLSNSPRSRNAAFDTDPPLTLPILRRLEEECSRRIDEDTEVISAIWTSSENHLLIRILESIHGASTKFIADTINCNLHRSRRFRTPSQIAIQCRRIFEEGAEAPSYYKVILERSLVMNSANTKLTTPKPSVAPKKMCLTAHPSHDVAARKANQNISKLFTPQELAQRRIQRTRIMTDASGAIINVPLPISTNTLPIAVPIAVQTNVPVAPPASANLTVPIASRTPGSPTMRTPSVPSMNTVGTPIQQLIGSNSAATTVPSRPINGLNIPAIGRPPSVIGNMASPTVSRPPTAVQNAIAFQQQQRQMMINRMNQVAAYQSAMQSSSRPISSQSNNPPGLGTPRTSKTTPSTSPSHIIGLESSPKKIKPQSLNETPSPSKPPNQSEETPQATRGGRKQSAKNN